MKLEEDELNRGELLDNIFQVFDKFGNQGNQGFTIAINGKYGTGKSTFLDFIQEKNQIEQKFNIVFYNAWEGNYFENPIVPIMYSVSKIASVGDKIINGAKKVLSSLPAILSEDIIKEYEEFKKSVENCKDILKKECESKKTILLVDELDRCLPEYQIKVLESLYHLLNVPGLIVVIAIDREQLEESIKSEFGAYTDTFGYLSKFIQYNIDLPNGTIYDYAIRLMAFKCEYLSEVKQIIASMLRSVNMSTRDMQIFVQQLNLICKEKYNSYGETINYPYYYPIIVAFMLLLKNTDNKIYQKYFGEPIEREYIEGEIDLKNTKYVAFLNDIKEHKFHNVLPNVVKLSYGESALLHIISLFDDIKKIKSEDLVQSLNSDSELFKEVMRDVRYTNYSFPSGVNNIIELLKIIK